VSIKGYRRHDGAEWIKRRRQLHSQAKGLQLIPGGIPHALLSSGWY